MPAAFGGPPSFEALCLPKSIKELSPLLARQHQALISALQAIPEQFSGERKRFAQGFDRGDIASDLQAKLPVSEAQQIRTLWDEMRPWLPYSTATLVLLDSTFFPLIEENIKTAERLAKGKPNFLSEQKQSLVLFSGLVKAAIRRRIDAWDGAFQSGGRRQAPQIHSKAYDDELDALIRSVAPDMGGSLSFLEKPTHGLSPETRARYGQAISLGTDIANLHELGDRAGRRLRWLKSYFTQAEAKKKSSKKKGTIQWLKKRGAWFSEKIGFSILGLFKGVLGISLGLSLFSLVLQGASVVGVVLASIAAAAAFTTFLTPTFNRFYQRISGGAQLKSLKESSNLEEHLRHNETFIIQELIARPRDISQSDLEGLANSAKIRLSLLKRLKALVLKEKKQKWNPLRNSSNRAISVLLRYLDRQAQDIQLALAGQGADIVDRFSEDVYTRTSAARERLMSKRSMTKEKLLEIKAFVKEYCTPEKQAEFKNKTDFIGGFVESLIARDLIIPIRESDSRLVLPFGGFSPNSHAINKHLSLLKDLGSAQEAQVATQLADILLLKTIPSTEALKSVLENLSSDTSDVVRTDEALRNYLFKTLNNYNPNILNLLNEKQKRLIKESYEALKEDLQKAINTIGDFLKGRGTEPKMDLIEKTLQMLSLSELVAHLVQEFPSLQTQAQEMLRRFIAQYKGHSLAPAHLQLLCALPEEEQAAAEEELALQRFNLLFEERGALQTGSIPLSRTDLSLFDRPSIRAAIEEQFWTHFQGLDDLEAKAFLGFSARAGIVGPHVLVAHQHARSLALTLPGSSLALALLPEEQKALLKIAPLVEEALARLGGRSIELSNPRAVSAALRGAPTTPILFFHILVATGDLERAAKYYLSLPPVTDEDPEALPEHERGPLRLTGSSPLALLGQAARRANVSPTTLLAIDTPQSREEGGLPLASFLHPQPAEESSMPMEHFEELFKSNILFARRAIRDPRLNNKVTGPLLEYALRHKGIFIDAILLMVRHKLIVLRDEISLEPKLILELRALADSPDPTAIYTAAELLGKEVYANAETYADEYLFSLLYPTKAQEMRGVHPDSFITAGLALRLLSYYPERVNIWAHILLNYPEGARARVFAVQKINTLIQRGGFSSQEEYDALANSMFELVGLDPKIPSDLEHIFNQLEFDLGRRGYWAQKIFKLGSSLKAFMSPKFNGIIKEITPYLVNLKLDRSVITALRNLYKACNSTHRDAIKADLAYIAQSGCSSDLKSVYVQVRILGQMHRQEEAQKLKGELRSELDKMSPTCGFVAQYQVLCQETREYNPAGLVRELRSVLKVAKRATARH